jgi:hypothetical protein
MPVDISATVAAEVKMIIESQPSPPPVEILVEVTREVILEVTKEVMVEVTKEILVIVTATPSSTPIPSPTPTPSSTPLPAPGYSRSDPADINADGLVIIDDRFGLRISLFEIIRGEEAWRMVREANMFNNAAKPGWEYILARIRVEAITSLDEDATFSLYGSLFTVVSTEGKEYDGSVITPEPRLSARLYAGASHQGWFGAEITEHDMAPLLTFGRDYSGRGGVWWKLYE